jgi:hypothetical protein
MIVVDYNLLTGLMKLCAIRNYILELCSKLLSCSPETSDDHDFISAFIGPFHITVYMALRAEYCCFKTEWQRTKDNCTLGNGIKKCQSALCGCPIFLTRLILYLKLMLKKLKRKSAHHLMDKAQGTIKKCYQKNMSINL